MKQKSKMILFAIILGVVGCEKVDENVTELNVDFSWGEMKECGSGNPAFQFSTVPVHTKFIKFQMYDHVYTMDHGTAVVPYDGVNEFRQGTFPKIVGPCPTSEPGRYEITIKALDENQIVVGVGSKERYYPEKN